MFILDGLFVVELGCEVLEGLEIVDDGLSEFVGLDIEPFPLFDPPLFVLPDIEPHVLLCLCLTVALGAL